MAPLRGWAPRGQRLVGKVPHGRWKTMPSCRIASRSHRNAVLLEGPIDGESFRLYLEKVHLPALRRRDKTISAAMQAVGSGWAFSVRRTQCG